MRLYGKKNVLEAARERIRWLFSEFDNVMVNYSGGKDSTIILNLALEAAEELGRLPLPVMFLDQESEWQAVIDHIREVMADPRVEPLWLQCPIQIFNSTSGDADWLMCWEPGVEWMREKEPDSIHENTFGTTRFKEMFGAFARARYGDEPMCYLTGMRVEESPARQVGLLSSATHKWATWGKMMDKRRHQVAMHPIYDWSYTDVWKAIHEQGWSYCSIYDAMYQHGIQPLKMRVSSLHHETSIHSLYFLQEVEGETYERLVKRLPGISTAGQLQRKAFHVADLPFMFESWREYRDFLLEKLIEDEGHRETFRKHFEVLDERYADITDKEMIHRSEISTILVNDYHFTKLNTLERHPALYTFRRWKAGKPIEPKYMRQYGYLIPAGEATGEAITQ